MHLFYRTLKEVKLYVWFITFLKKGVFIILMDKTSLRRLNENAVENILKIDGFSKTIIDKP